MVYEKIDKCDVADARFLPWCACPLSPACRSLATTAKSGAAMGAGMEDAHLRGGRRPTSTTRAAISIAGRTRSILGSLLAEKAKKASLSSS